VLLSYRGQGAPHTDSPDSLVSLPEAISVDRIGIFRYLSALRRRQYSVLSHDPRKGKELAQAFSDVEGNRNLSTCSGRRWLAFTEWRLLSPVAG
jgi:hypothetical protein